MRCAAEIKKIFFFCCRTLPAYTLTHPSYTRASLAQSQWINYLFWNSESGYILFLVCRDRIKKTPQLLQFSMLGELKWQLLGKLDVRALLWTYTCNKNENKIHKKLKCGCLLDVFAHIKFSIFSSQTKKAKKTNWKHIYTNMSALSIYIWQPHKHFIIY